MSVASVAAAGQVYGKYRKQQKSPIVRDMPISRLTCTDSDAKLELNAVDLTERLDSFVL